MPLPPYSAGSLWSNARCNRQRSAGLCMTSGEPRHCPRIGFLTSSKPVSLRPAPTALTGDALLITRQARVAVTRSTLSRTIAWSRGVSLSCNPARPPLLHTTSQKGLLNPKALFQSAKMGARDPSVAIAERLAVLASHVEPAALRGNVRSTSRSRH